MIKKITIGIIAAAIVSIIFYTMKYYFKIESPNIYAFLFYIFGGINMMLSYIILEKNT